MNAGRNSRPNRTPPDPDEIRRRYELIKKQKQKKQQRFKSSKTFITLNVLSIICYFLQWELLFCFFGPCQFSVERPPKTEVRYGAGLNSRGERYLKEVVIVMPNEFINKVQVNQYLKSGRPEFGTLRVGKDFIMRKWLKVWLDADKQVYWLRSASPMVFICAFVILVTSIGFFFNLNEHPMSLGGMAVTNLLTIVAVLCL